MIPPGDGLFETLRVDEGRAREVDPHLDRLLAGLDRIGLRLAEDRPALAAAIASAAAAAPRPVARLRLTVTREAEGPPTRRIDTLPYSPPADEGYTRGVDAILLAGAAEPRLDSRDPWAGLKRVGWDLGRSALRRAEAAGAFEALLLNERGRLVEGSRTNLVLVIDGEAVTPPLADGCLPGTVRRRLLEAGAVHERSLDPETLAQAQEILLTNSLIGVLPLGRLDGRELSPGPVATRLRELSGF